MNDKLYRNYSSEENKAWWKAIERAANKAPKLVGVKPLKGDERFVWHPMPRSQQGRTSA